MKPVTSAVTSFAVVVVVAVVALLQTSCDAETCQRGSESCACIEAQCFNGLTCLSGRCVALPGGASDGGTASDAETDATTDAGTDIEVTPPGPSTACPILAGAVTGFKSASGVGADEVMLSFASGGALLSIQAVTCAIDPAGDATPGQYCRQGYLCGPCQVRVSRGEGGEPGVYVAPGQDASCDAFQGDYRVGICEPSCTAGRTCDGASGVCVEGSNAPCTSDANCLANEYCATGIGRCRIDQCQVCIQDCQSIPGGIGCCTCGGGCVCASECSSLCLP